MYTKNARHPCRATGIPSPKVFKWVRDRAVEAGAAPEDVPEPPFHMLRIDQAAKVCGLSRATLYRLIEKGEFPRPIPLIRGAVERDTAAA